MENLALFGGPGGSDAQLEVLVSARWVKREIGLHFWLAGMICMSWAWPCAPTQWQLPFTSLFKRRCPYSVKSGSDHVSLRLHYTTLSHPASPPPGRALAVGTSTASLSRTLPTGYSCKHGAAPCTGHCARQQHAACTAPCAKAPPAACSPTGISCSACPAGRLALSCGGPPLPPPPPLQRWPAQAASPCCCPAGLLLLCTRGPPDGPVPGGQGLPQKGQQ